MGKCFPRGNTGCLFLADELSEPTLLKIQKNSGRGHWQAERQNKVLHGQQTRTWDAWPGAKRSCTGYLWKHVARASSARCCWRHRQSLLQAWKAAGRALCWKWLSALACNSWSENREWPFVLYVKKEKSLSRSHSQGRTAFWYKHLLKWKSSLLMSANMTGEKWNDRWKTFPFIKSELSASPHIWPRMCVYIYLSNFFSDGQSAHPHCPVYCQHLINSATYMGFLNLKFISPLPCVLSILFLPYIFWFYNT